MSAVQRPFGAHLRHWREQRRMSQMALAGEADISTRHLSFIETGRARPSREMVLRLAEPLRLPLRERNQLMLAAGFAPAYSEQPYDAADPAMAAARSAVETLLRAHEPWPALAVDRHWQLVAANRVVGRLLDGVAPALLAPPVNVLRLSLHPDGLALRIRNLGEWREHVLARLRQQIDVAQDERLQALHAELEALPGAASATADRAPAALLVPLRLASPAGELSLISTTTVFGTPVDVTLSELAIESFFPADAATAERLRAWHAD